LKKIVGGAPIPVKCRLARLGHFIAHFNFDCKYLWNGLTYRQGVNGVINYCLFCVEQKTWWALAH